MFIAWTDAAILVHPQLEMLFRVLPGNIDNMRICMLDEERDRFQIATGEAGVPEVEFSNESGAGLSRVLDRVELNKLIPALLSLPTGSWHLVHSARDAKITSDNIRSLSRVLRGMHKSDNSLPLGVERVLSTVGPRLGSGPRLVAIATDSSVAAESIQMGLEGLRAAVPRRVSYICCNPPKPPTVFAMLRGDIQTREQVWRQLEARRAHVIAPEEPGRSFAGSESLWRRWPLRTPVERIGQVPGFDNLVLASYKLPASDDMNVLLQIAEMYGMPLIVLPGHLNRHKLAVVADHVLCKSVLARLDVLETAHWLYDIDTAASGEEAADLFCSRHAAQLPAPLLSSRSCIAKFP